MASIRPKTILVAEDSSAIRSILAFLLRGRGFNVLEAGDGGSAMEMIRTMRPDAVILDVYMPGRTGLDLCVTLKADDSTRNIPVLILSALTRESGNGDAYWKRVSGADDFISKPFRAHDLLRRMERLLSGPPENLPGNQPKGSPASSQELT